MNAERLYLITDILQKEFERLKLTKRIEKIRVNLQNTINQPNQASHQQNLSTELTSLYTDLTNSKVNDFSPSWTQLVDEIGGLEISGLILKERIENIISSNQLTPSIAMEEITKIKEHVDSFYSGLNQITKGFNLLKIEREDLDFGQVELGVLIPRKFVDNKLADLGKEIGEINFILKIICEATTGKIEEFEVRTISSSDFTFYLLAGIFFAEKFTAILEKIIINYKSILEIKKLKLDLKNQGVSEESMKGISDHANNSMKKVIKEIIEEIFNEENPVEDEGRKNELKNGTEVALNKLSNRIDNGFSFDVRPPELPEPEKDEDGNPVKTQEYEEMEDLVISILDSAGDLQFKRIDGDPILNLPEAISKSKKSNTAKK